MNVSSFRPRIADLVFQVYQKRLHPEFFQILAQRRIVRDGYDISIRITSTGHSITYEKNGLILSEVLVPADLIIPATPCLLHHGVRGEHTFSIVCAEEVHYQSSIQLEILSAEVFQHVQEEIVSDGKKNGLLYHFQPAHRLESAPVGLITVQSGLECLLWTAFHTFPEENGVIKSQTLIEKRKKIPGNR